MNKLPHLFDTALYFIVFIILGIIWALCVRYFKLTNFSVFNLPGQQAQTDMAPRGHQLHQNLFHSPLPLKHSWSLYLNQNLLNHTFFQCGMKWTAAKKSEAKTFLCCCQPCDVTFDHPLRISQARYFRFCSTFYSTSIPDNSNF